MRRVLLMTIDFPPRRGGVARYLSALASHLRDRVLVVAEPEEESEAVDAAAPYPVRRERLLGPWASAILSLIRHRDDYDVAVTSHVLPIGTAAWIARLATKRPYWVILHGMDLHLARRNGFKRWLSSRVLAGAELVVVNSRALEREARAAGALHAEVIYPCPGIDPMDPIPHEGARLLSVSRLVPRKGHVRVLEALALLREQRRLGDITYRIVGAGPAHAEIANAIERLGLEGIAFLEGAPDDDALREAYAASDIFVMPTSSKGADREGFGIVYLEAASFGLPSIATDQPGVSEAVLDGGTGMLVPDGDVEALAEAIHRLATDEALRQRLGEAGRERARKEFQWGRQLKRLEAHL